MPSRPAAQLVVDTTRLMPLSSDDAQTPSRLDLFMIGLPAIAQRSHLLLPRGFIQGLVGLEGLNHLLDIAAEHDVCAPPGHIGGDGDHAGAARLRHDLSFAGMLLGIEHLMRQLLALEQLGDDLRVFDRGGTHQDRLPAFMAIPNVGDSGVVLFGRGFVDPIELIVAAAGPVGGTTTVSRP